MGRKHTYATKSQLETLARRMHKTGILYYEALEEFKKQFILVVLRDVNWNKSKTAEYWACTEALWFAAFESCTSTIALSAMPNAVRRMALAHRGRTETWDDSLGNESARSLLSRLPQNLKEEICHHCLGSSRAYAPRRTSALKASLISACSSQLRVSLSCTKRR